ncbi:MAG: hypothetical protein ACRDIV_01580 [Ktedonobacteraceae bacterium]
MSSDYSREQGIEGITSSEQSVQPGIQPYALPFFAVQLQNVVPIDILARRFPGDKNSITLSPDTQISPPAVHINLEEPVLKSEFRQAQVLMNLQVLSTDIPPLFEISLKLAGGFTYNANYGEEQVIQFLRSGSLSVMLPFARELLLSICNRLQMPMIALPLILLAPPPTDTQAGDTAQQ